MVSHGEQIHLEDDALHKTFHRLFRYIFVIWTCVIWVYITDCVVDLVEKPFLWDLKEPLYQSTQVSNKWNEHRSKYQTQHVCYFNKDVVPRSPTARFADLSIWSLRVIFISIVIQFILLKAASRKKNPFQSKSSVLSFAARSAQDRIKERDLFNH